MAPLPSSPVTRPVTRPAPYWVKAKAPAMTTKTFNGMTASQLNASDAYTCDNFFFEVKGRRVTIYSDATGQLRRIRAIYPNNDVTKNPAYIVAEILATDGSDFIEYARPAFEWAKARGLWTESIHA